MNKPDDLDGFVESATDNLKRDIDLRLDVIPQEYQERLALNLIHWLEARLGFCECQNPAFAPFVECENCGKPPRP